MSVVGVPVAPVWCGPGLREQVTQALLGEPVLVLDEEGPWLDVALPWQPGPDPRGYRGWVAREQVVDGTPPAPGEPSVTVTAPVATLEEGTDHGAGLLSFGTRLRAAGRDVLLPGGRRARIREQPAAGCSLALARLHTGLPYVWGGLSGWGLDCSGLVHLTHRVAGRCVPRDAADQHVAAEPVGAADVRPGDVYFFATGTRVSHVGFATGTDPSGGRSMLHATDRTGVVEEDLMEPDRRASLVGAGRFVDGW